LRVGGVSRVVNSIRGVEHFVLPVGGCVHLDESINFLSQIFPKTLSHFIHYGKQDAQSSGGNSLPFGVDNVNVKLGELRQEEKTAIGETTNQINNVDTARGLNDRT